MSETIALIGEKQVGGARVLALRSALRLEVHGMRRSRGQSALGILRDMGIHNERTAKAALPVVNEWVKANLGI